MNELWISCAEVVAATGWSARTVRIKARTGGELRWRYRTSSGRGRRSREFAASSLPADAQKKIFEQQIAAAATIALTPEPAAADSLQPALFSPSQLLAAPARLVVQPGHRETAAQRHETIAPLLDWKKGWRPVFNDADGTPFESSDQLARYLAAQNNVGVRTIWRWYARFDRTGFGGLIKKTRSDKGSSRFFRDFPLAEQFAQTKYLRERLSVQLTYEALAREWPTLYNHGSQPPSYSCVRAYLERLPRAIVVVARDGERGFNHKIEPFLQRDFDSVAVNQIWVSDHRIFDVFRYNDVFPHERPYSALRIWHTMILDMRSRKIVGWAFCVNPSSQSIASALHMAVSQYGLPETFYVDNGKDYKKIGKPDELAREVEGLVHQLGINVQYCLPAHPQSKLVESFFSGQSKRFDALFGNAYAGRKPALRPEECQSLLELHKKWHKGELPTTPLEPASSFIELAEQWFREYNDHPHSGRGMDGRTPNQVFDALAPERTIPDLLALAPLFWDRERRKVLRGGCVERFKQTFEPADAESAARMTLAIGNDVIVACDPTDIGEAVVCDLDGNVTARMRAIELVAHGPVSREAIRSSLRERRAMLKAIKNYVSWVSREVPTEIELLRQRAGVDPTPKILPPANLPRLAGAAVTAAAPAYVGDVAEDIVSELAKGN